MLEKAHVFEGLERKFQGPQCCLQSVAPQVSFPDLSLKSLPK